MNKGRAIPWSRVPVLSQAAAWNDRRRQKHDEKIAEKKAKMELLESDAKQRLSGAPVTQKEAPLEGVISLFDKELATALQFGGKMDAAAPTDEAAIRTVLCTKEFIAQIAGATANSPMATPIEEADGTYADAMCSVRQGLAAKLSAGTIPSLTVDELDILYTAILGNGARWGAASEGGFAWPAGAQTPPEAFFDFLAATAAKNSAGKEDEFMAAVLLTLAASVTRNETMNESAKGRARRTLADVQYVDAELGRRADRQFEGAVAAFKESVDGTLSTPKTELSRAGTPGLGFVGYVPGVTAAVNECKAAAASQRNAQIAYDAANKAYGRDPSQDNETALRNAEAGLNAANARVAAANQRLAILVPDLPATNAEAMAHLSSLIQNEAEPGRISRQATDRFRTVFREVCMAGRLDNEGMNAALNRLGDTGNCTLMAIAGGIKTAIGHKSAGDAGQAGVEAAAVNGMMGGAELPDQVIGELGQVVDAITNEAPGPAVADVDRITERYAYPLRNAARQILLAYMEGIAEIGELPIGRWLATRIKFQGEAKVGRDPRARYEGRFAWIAKDLHRMINVQWPENQLLKRLLQAVATIVIPIYPLLWLRQYTIGNRNFSRELRGQARLVNTGHGQVPSRWKRLHTGILQATTAVLIVAEAITAYVCTVRQFGLLEGTAKYFTSSGFPFFRPTWNYLSAAPGNIGRSPGEWWSSELRDEDRLKAHDDDMNIPERLKGRGHGYYRNAYGVGCDTSSDAAVKEANARLKWLHDRPEVLRFLQERTSGVHVNGWKLLPKGPSSMKIEYTKNRKGDTVAVADTVYQVLQMDTIPIADGLVLNRTNADAFVDTLRALEGRKANGTGALGRGKKIDYAYLDANKLEWENRGFLISEGMRELMAKCRIRDGANAQFLAVQPRARALIEARAELGTATEYIEKPDEFVRLLRNRIIQIAGADPLTTAVGETDITDAFDNAKAAAWGNLIRDATAEFQQRTIMEQVNCPDMSQTTRDILLANADIRSMLLEFTTTQSGYLIAPGRLNDFVQRLLLHKKANAGSADAINDYSPFTSPQGGRVAWAMSQGYFNAKGFGPAEAQAGDSSSGTHAQRQATQSMPLSAEASAFYNGSGGAALKSLLDGIGVSDNGRQALYATMNNSVRAKSLKNQTTIAVTGSGQNMAASIADRQKAETWLKNHYK